MHVFDAVSKRDVPSLGVIHAADGRPVRWGTEILLEKDGELLRLLSVHLKFGCHQAAQELVPFVILGDFNRRFDRFGQNDHFWREIDDDDPRGLDLRRLPLGHEAECNPNFPQPIDFLVFDDRAWRLLEEASFQEVTYDPEDQDLERGTPSDHCAIAVSLELTLEDDGGCVVVTWSEASVDSDWVRKEAENGIQRNNLIPVRLADIASPCGLGDWHTTDLMDWDGTPEAAEFEKLVQRRAFPPRAHRPELCRQQVGDRVPVEL
jgi:TIR domain